MYNWPLSFLILTSSLRGWRHKQQTTKHHIYDRQKKTDVIYISRWLWCPDSERFNEQPTSISNRPALSKHVTLDGPPKVIIYSSSQCQHNPAGAQIFYTTLHKETKCACNNTTGKYFWFSFDKPLILQWFHSPWREELRRPLILSLPLELRLLCL